MMKTWTLDDAVEHLVTTQDIFQLTQAHIRGVEYTVFKNVPAHLRDLLLTSRTPHGDGKADYLVFEDERWSYDAFIEEIRQTAWRLRSHHGVEGGTPVALAMRNFPELLILMMGIVSAGGVVVFLNAWWTTEEMEYAVSDSGASLVFADFERFDRLRPLSDTRDLELVLVRDQDGKSLSPNPLHGPDCSNEIWPEISTKTDDDFAIMYSSGTTGRPKGVVQTHRGAISAVFSWLMQVPLGDMLNPPDPEAKADKPSPAILVVTPLFHVTATHPMFLLSLPAGAKLILMRKWDAKEAVKIIEREGVTRFLGVPTQSADLMSEATRQGTSLSSLDFLGAGGAKRPPAQVSELKAAFPKANIATGWGMTETNACGLGFVGDEYLENPNAAGRLYPPLQELRILDDAGNDVALGDVGEITVKSACNMRCYLNKPQETEEVFENGWLKTGDLGKVDENGIVTILDRKKNIIIRGGENIACLDVEAALHRHPAVAESCAFSVPDERLGEVVGAGVHMREGVSVTPNELRVFLKGIIAHFKIPEYIWIQSTPLPRGATDKLDRRSLRQSCLAQLNQQRTRS